MAPELAVVREHTFVAPGHAALASGGHEATKALAVQDVNM